MRPHVSANSLLYLCCRREVTNERCTRLTAEQFFTKKRKFLHSDRSNDYNMELEVSDLNYIFNTNMREFQACPMYEDGLSRSTPLPLEVDCDRKEFGRIAEVQSKRCANYLHKLKMLPINRNSRSHRLHSPRRFYRYDQSEQLASLHRLHRHRTLPVSHAVCGRFDHTRRACVRACA